MPPRVAMPQDLDSIVKGTASPPAEKAAEKIAATSGVTAPSARPGDPLSHAPSSPSMIYLNLLILEASLRAQYLELRARRRHHTFFLSILTVWILAFAYALFFAPREDGRGVGGSVYWGVEMIEKLCFMGGIITAALVWATGIWDRGVRWPRRWFAITNRGIRAFNLKLVLVKRSWYAEALSTLAWFLTYGLFSHTAGSSYHFVDPAILRDVDKHLDMAGRPHPALPPLSSDDDKTGREEDLAPGGDYVKLLLLPKPFSPTFREDWELYRTEYWDRENERRALFRLKRRERDRRLRKEHFGWFWWAPWARPPPVPDRPPSHAHPEKPQNRRHSVADPQGKRSRSGSIRRGSMSGNSSRSLTPTHEAKEGAPGRRPSDASQKKKKALSPAAARSGKRPVTPEYLSPLARESSLSGTTPRDSGTAAAAAADRRPKSASDPA